MATIWGEITGLITDQDDLQAELDKKSNGLNLTEEQTSGKFGWILKDNNGRGWAGPIGEYAVDFTFQNTLIPDRIEGATGDYSFAQGRSTLASGNTSTVFGLKNITAGNYSFSVGRDNQSLGLQSFTLGQGNIAEGISSFTGGTNSTISASGTNTFQTGLNSFAFGDNLIANNPNQVVFGKYNLQSDTDNSTLYKIFTIGIGTATDARQNAFEVFNGAGSERGSVKAPYLQQDTIDEDVTGKVLITKEYFENRLSWFGDAPINGKDYVRKNKQWVLLPSATNVSQVYYKGTVFPPIPQPDENLPNPNTFDTGDVYLHYNLPTYDLVDGNIIDADGNDVLWDGNIGGGKNYKQYILQNKKVLPADPDQYVWEEMTFGIEDAPAGLVYNRTLNSWNVAAIQTDANFDGTPYSRQDGNWVPAASGGGTSVVFKGTEDPNTIVPVFGNTGDNYMKTESTIGSYIDYSVQETYSVGETQNYLSYSAWNNDTIISGTPDAQTLNIIQYDDGTYYLRIQMTDSTEKPADWSFTINGVIFYTDDADWGSEASYYTWRGSQFDVDLAQTWTNIRNNSDVADVRSGNVIASDYEEYTKLSSGTWKLVEWGIKDAALNAIQYVRKGQTWQPINIIAAGGLTDVDTSTDGDYVRRVSRGSTSWATMPVVEAYNPPIDIKLKNADITLIEYDLNDNLSKMTYGSVPEFSLIGGYTSEYVYDSNLLLTSIRYLNGGITLVLTVNYTYDTNNNLKSVIRTTV